MPEAHTTSDDDDEDMETQCDCAGGHAVQGARTEGNECISVVIITNYPSQSHVVFICMEHPVHYL